MLIQIIYLYLIIIDKITNLRLILNMCPIPSFDHNHVLPPHTGNPTSSTDVSPYEATIVEFCQIFATSQERIEILKGLVSFRLRMIDFGIIDGFQWLDGSFTENIEKSEGRPPNDIDIVTFYKGLSDLQQKNIIINFKEFVSPLISKKVYKLDHYPVDFGYNPLQTVEATKYWIQLFCHNRKGVWKGMVKLPLSNDKAVDNAALSFLNSL